ncbi:MAG: class I SAM-dependent methyltransferase [Phenylobacterium sp.]
MTDIDRSGAAEFEDADVVAAYVHRPPYPDALIARLLDLAPAQGHVLDLGCGPGKLARALAPHVETVTAVDPSAAMLRLARDLDAGRNRNIAWTHARAEDLDLAPGSLHLAVAGAAIHWIDPAALFPKLAHALAPGAPVAIVEGDVPTDAPWIEPWNRTIRDWVARLGGVWEDGSHQARMTAHEPWLGIQARETFTAAVGQRVEDLIACQHSRATWARRRMGALAEAFDADLRAVLAPWAADGMVEYEMETRLAWGWAQV